MVLCDVLHFILTQDLNSGKSIETRTDKSIGAKADKCIAVRKTKGMEMSMPIFIYSVLYDETG